MGKEKAFSIQEWVPFDKIMPKGIIKNKNNEYVKIIKVIPINYNLKSDLEKEAILSSYKAFLKNCNFEIQIIIQSNKEDISENIKKLNKQNEYEKSLNNNFIVNLSNQYIKFIKQKNKEKLSTSKNFYILISSSKSPENQEDAITELKEKYFKIKDSLARCGNIIYEIKEKEELETIIYSFFNKEK